MKVYVTKYALTTGIQEHEVEEGTVNDISRKYVYARSGHGISMQFVMGRDAFATRAEALQVAEKARKAKIESLNKQIRKLGELNFSA